VRSFVGWLRRLSSFCDLGANWEAIEIKKVLIICTVGDTVGWGHFSRSKALSEHLDGSLKYNTVMLVQAQSPRAIQDYGSSGSFVWVSSTSQLVAQAESYLGEDIARVIIDHPTLSDGAVKDLVSHFGPLVFFFSIHRRYLDPSMVHKLIVPRLRCPASIKFPANKLVFGLRYTPLRLNFYRLKAVESISDEFDLPGLFICMGGGNQVAKISRVIESLELLGYAKPIVIVVSKSSAEFERLVSMTHCTIRIVEDPSEIEIIQLIDHADIGLVSAGTVAQECFSRGLICGVSEVAEDQAGLSWIFEQAGLAIAVDVNHPESISRLTSITTERRRLISDNLKKVDYQSGISELINFINE